MSEWNSLKHILRDYIEYDDRDCTEPYYSVGERTIYVLDIVMEMCLQFEIQDIEQLLLEGGFRGEYRIEVDVLDITGKELKTTVIDLTLLRIPHHSTAMRYDAKQRQ